MCLAYHYSASLHNFALSVELLTNHGLCVNSFLIFYVILFAKLYIIISLRGRIVKNILAVSRLYFRDDEKSQYYLYKS